MSGSKQIFLSVSFLFLDLLFFYGLFAQFDNTSLIVKYDSAWEYKNLKLIPVRYQREPAGDAVPLNKNTRIITLSQAMREKKIKINELPKNVGADVSVLKIRNESEDYILINTGEVVTGGKQDRASGETVLLPPDKEDFYLKTYCVEKGRWTKKEKPFKYFNPAELSIKKIIDVEKNQAHVWNEIERQYKTVNQETDTWSYPEITNRSRSAEDSGYFKFFTDKFAASDSMYAGFIAVTDNRIITTDLYAVPQLTINAYPAILHTYIRFAIFFGEKPVIPDAAVMHFMEPIFADAKTRKEFLLKHGATHYFNGKPIHIVAYGN